jgi:DNA repair exonuclease SbcCD nuclease subunit
MYTFLHAADIHLDSPLRGLSRHEDAPTEALRGATRRAFENLVDHALEERVAFVLLAGDLYDGSWKDYSTGIFIARQLGRLGKRDIPVFAVTGNHDAASQITGALDPPANLTFLSSRAPETVVLPELGVALHGQGYARPHIDQNLAADFPEAHPDRLNIGLLHTSLDGREGHADYAPCKPDDLRSRGYQYWALGHVHQPEVVDRDPWIVYPGCLQGRHIRETGPKGATRVTVQDGAIAAVEPVALDVLRWERAAVDVSGAEDVPAVLDRVRAALRAALEDAQGRPLALRVALAGATAAADALAAHPGRLDQQIRALAAELGDDELWVEKVELTATGQRDLAAALAEEDGLGTLLEELLRVPADPEAVEGLSDELATLRQKLPPEAWTDEAGRPLDDPARLGDLIREARGMLVGRLLASEGDTP